MRLHPDSLLYRNRFTFLSLIIILFMVFVVQNYYDPNSITKKVVSSITGSNTNLGGAFELVKGGSGQPMTQEILQGKYTLLYFGFTYCPDICPTALNSLSIMYDNLSDKQKEDVQVVMITVDPERDTVGHLGEYVKAFHDDFIGLTGSDDQIQQAASAYKVYYAKGSADQDGFYMMDHSGFIYLVGPDGRYLENFTHGAHPADIERVIKGYLHK